jgi:hypothetical protein
LNYNGNQIVSPNARWLCEFVPANDGLLFKVTN